MPLRILILEDHMVIAWELEARLEMLGSEVIALAKDVPSALKLIDEGETIDLAILDINLEGGGSGYEVASALAEREIPFLFATGYDHTTIDPRFIDRPVLEKPFNDRQLLEAIQTACA